MSPENQLHERPEAIDEANIADRQVQHSTTSMEPVPASIDGHEGEPEDQPSTHVADADKIIAADEALYAQIYDALQTDRPAALRLINHHFREGQLADYVRYERARNAGSLAERIAADSDQRDIGAAAVSGELSAHRKYRKRRTHGAHAARTVERSAGNGAETEPVIVEERLEWGATLRKYQHPDREVIEVVPDRIQQDPSTAAPLAPIVFVHGIAGDDKLADELAIFAECGQRPAIGVRPADKVRGMSSRLIDAGLSEKVTKIDDFQAEELMQSLAERHVKEFDLVALSRGAIRAVIAKARLAREPNGPRVVETFLAHPGGQDGRSFIRRHWNAARLGYLIGRQYRRGEIPRPPRPAVRQPLRHKRILQRSMASSNLNQTLVDIPFDRDTQSNTIAGGLYDRGVPAADLERNIKDTSKVDYMTVDWGGSGHGFGANPRAAIAMICDYLLEKKRARAERLLTSVGNPAARGHARQAGT